MAANITRRKQILDLLMKNNSLPTGDLAEQLNVSMPTIRRDLDDLEQKGLITRSWGTASIIKEEKASPVEKYTVRNSSNTREKKAIALKCLELISDGDSLILDSGTTTEFLAHELYRFKNLTVITNSVYIINALIDSDVTLLSCGGTLDKKNLCFVGPEAEDFFKNIHVTKAFMGATSMSIPLGFSCFSPFQRTIKQAMLRASDRSYFLMDSSKVNAHAISKVADFDDVSCIITDKPFSAADESFLHSRHVQLIYA